MGEFGLIDRIRSRVFLVSLPGMTPQRERFLVRNCRRLVANARANGLPMTSAWSPVSQLVERVTAGFEPSRSERPSWRSCSGSTKSSSGSAATCRGERREQAAPDYRAERCTSPKRKRGIIKFTLALASAYRRAAVVGRDSRLHEVGKRIHCTGPSHSPVVRYSWIDAAALRPAAMARMTVAAAGDDVARREDALLRGPQRLGVGGDVALAVGLEVGRRRLHQGVGPGAQAR